MGILIHWKQHVYVLWCMAYVFKWGTCEKSNINHCTRRFILAQVKHQNLIPRSWEKTVPTDLDNNFNINATFWSFWIKTYKNIGFAYYIFLCRTSVWHNRFGTARNVQNRQILSAQEISLKEKGKPLISSIRCLQSGENFVLSKTFTLWGGSHIFLYVAKASEVAT